MSGGLCLVAVAVAVDVDDFGVPTAALAYEWGARR
jgi:hypothetical protein